ncbi:MAG: dTMP kinase [Sphingomonadaceae bacterium]
MSRFIAFEGGEGAGKTTQISLLADYLRARGHDVVTTREPGGTPGAEAIRSLLVEGAAGRWTAESDSLLFAAARADHVARLIRPALAAGKIVLCDRFVHSTFAYQGGGNGLDMDKLRALHDFCSGGLWPDLVLWLDLPPQEGLRRAAARHAGVDRFEQRDSNFHARVHAAFAQMAGEDSRMRRIDAMQGVDAVAAAIRQAMEA